ncbi:MAG: glycosyltransferase [Candidatus Pacearchaeota archaeon]
MNPEVSCIIITKNEEKYLPRLLESLKNQSYKNFEIIVSDFNSEDNTKQIAKKYGCKIVQGGKASLGRNNGAKASQGKYLLFLDADSILPKRFIEINLKKFIKSGKGVGTIEVKPDSNKLLYKIFYKIYHIWVIFFSKISPHSSGCAIFTTKKVFNKINGFNERVIFAEDHDYAKRAGKYGFVILPVPAYTSIRRFEREGKLKVALKLTYGGIIRIFHKEIEKPLFRYD